jgi:broad specificity phosphatase PhoE
MKEIYFIRHGQTDCNKFDDGICYVEDAPLNKKGKKQAKKTGEYLKKYRMNDKPFDCMITSPRTRANQTANIIADEINYKSKNGDSEVTKIQIIKELGRGKMDEYYEAHFEITEKLKDPIERWKAEHEMHKLIQEKYNLKNMDDIQDIEKRLEDFVHHLKSMKEKKILVVSHYGFLFTALLPKIFNVPSEAFQHYTGKSPDEDNCAISYCLYDEDKDTFTMVMPPSTEHLKL